MVLLLASLGDYDESKHSPGYTDEFKEFILLPKEEQVRYFIRPLFYYASICACPFNP